MMDYQQLVDSLRGFLAATDQTRTDELEEWAKEYVQCCKQTNDRLRRCQGYLKKGLRAEAIHLAEEHPQLLDVVPVLAFPELAEWREKCGMYSLPEPPPLLMDVAASINEAYAEIEPVTNLLARHRVMGLARAPIADHLIVIRRLAELDPTSPFWETDVRAFEKARLEEIRSDIKTGLENRDHEFLARLQSELQRANWRTAISKELRQHVDQALRSTKASTGERLLRELLPELHSAYSAMNVSECKELVSKWDQIVQAAGMSVPAALEDELRPVNQWLEEEDKKARRSTEFEAACQILQNGLDADAPSAELERAFHLASAFELELPSELESRYVNRIKAREAAIRHRRQLHVDDQRQMN